MDRLHPQPPTPADGSPQVGLAAPGPGRGLWERSAPRGFSRVRQTHLSTFGTPVLPHTPPTPGPPLRSNRAWKWGFGFQGVQGALFPE